MAERMQAMRPVGEVVRAGPGSQQVGISVHNEQVVIHFDRAVEWSAFDPEGARRFAEEMAKFAYKARYGQWPTDADNRSFLADGVRRRITDAIREKMVSRTMMLLRNFEDKKPPLAYQAREIVMRVLQEVL